MSFPTTALLDDFNRADGAPGGNWTSPSMGESGTLSIISQTLGNVSGTWAGALYSGTYGPDAETYCTIATPGVSGQRFILWLRGSGSGTTCSGYTLEIDCLGGSWDLYRNSAGVGTWVTSMSQIVGAGDQVGFSAIGSQIIAYHKPSGGSWTQKMTYNDASPILTSGWLGIKSFSNVYRSDDFSGGTVVTVVTDSCLPDADITTTGWTTAPLFSKVNDASDATVIQATAV